MGCRVQGDVLYIILQTVKCNMNKTPSRRRALIYMYVYIYIYIDNSYIVQIDHCNHQTTLNPIRFSLSLEQRSQCIGYLFLRTLLNWFPPNLQPGETVVPLETYEYLKASVNQSVCQPAVNSKQPIYVYHPATNQYLVASSSSGEIWEHHQNCVLSAVYVTMVTHENTAGSYTLYSTGLAQHSRTSERAY